MLDQGGSVTVHTCNLVPQSINSHSFYCLTSNIFGNMAGVVSESSSESSESSKSELVWSYNDKSEGKVSVKGPACGCGSSLSLLLSSSRWPWFQLSSSLLSCSAAICQSISLTELLSEAMLILFEFCGSQSNTMLLHMIMIFLKSSVSATFPLWNCFQR